MMSVHETPDLKFALRGKKWDPEIFIGVAFENNGVTGTIRDYNSRGLFEVDFDSDYMTSTGGFIRQGRIAWPDCLDLSDSQISQLLNSPSLPPANFNYAAMERAEAELERHQMNMDVTHECEVDDDSEIEAERAENMEYNDSASKSHDDGWFYSDDE